MAKTSLRTWHARNKSPLFWLVTGLGVGMLRPAPGTWGSLFGLFLGYGLLKLQPDAITLVVLVACLTVVSSLAINKIEARIGIHDAPEIIIDEVAGQWLALVPVTMFEPSLTLYVLAFLLFRFFDIIKPWPIGWLDKKVAGGFGVMVDDLVAGILAGFGIIILQITGLLDGLY
ncbi:phosphatidylglycerophosphatase A [Kordiimonas sp.]|uniref:phosphatidylglycerophosphatase A family protein n=1 Tax=Kordiimonas sp. TaxID=1970157 RepID=UPI003A93AE6E